MATGGEGTHLTNSRPRGGWPNACDPEVKPGRKIRKARKRLADRIKSYEDTVVRARSAAGAFRRPGSLKVK